MPKEWYDRSANRITEDLTPEEVKRRRFNLRILADKKPYFMRYIYPDLMKEYNTYIKNVGKKCMRRFRRTIKELLEKSPEELTAAEKEFIWYYGKRMPVGTHPCVMNRICRRFENEFDNYFPKNVPEEDFDYSIMKSGQDYTATQYNKISELYDRYIKRVCEYMQFSKRERIDEDESATTRSLMAKGFRAECEQVCSNSAQLCDIILDLCYSQSGSKQFCWDICGREIINNLLNNNGNVIRYPVRNENGNIEFCGERFSFESKGKGDI